MPSVSALRDCVQGSMSSLAEGDGGRGLLLIRQPNPTVLRLLSPCWQVVVGFKHDVAGGDPYLPWLALRDGIVCQLVGSFSYFVDNGEVERTVH